jgi:NAD(P)-dependent dehydrogenase (short-subunit alcohol dehydrogenase family)
MILVTTAGQVGSEAARLLAQRGELVRVLVRDRDKAAALALAGVDIAKRSSFGQFATGSPGIFVSSTNPRSGNGVMMPTTTDTSRTARLLALMKKGDDAFNARDFAAVDEVHHPEMIAYITGLAEPVYGKEAHAAAMQQFVRIFPDMHVYSDPYPIQFGSGDWITVITNATGTFIGEMTLPDGTVIPPTGKAFDVEFGQTTKWDGDQLIVISAFWDAAVQRQQIGLA